MLQQLSVQDRAALEAALTLIKIKGEQIRDLVDEVITILERNVE